MTLQHELEFDVYVVCDFVLLLVLLFFFLSLLLLISTNMFDSRHVCPLSLRSVVRNNANIEQRKNDLLAESSPKVSTNVSTQVDVI